MKTSWFINLLMGLVLLVGGAWMVVYTVQHPPINNGLVYAFLIVAILGALLINPTPGNPAPLLTVIKSVVLIVAPIIPWSKVAVAKRASTEVASIKPDNDAGPG